MKSAWFTCNDDHADNTNLLKESISNCKYFSKCNLK